MPVLASPQPYAQPQNVAFPTDAVWKLTLDQYHAMIEHGILPSGTPAELLDGILVPRMRKSPPHCYSTRLTRDALEQLAPPGWFVITLGPVTFGESEPEPDVSLVRGSIVDYAKQHPSPSDLGIVVEVAESSQGRDRDLKQLLYSQDGIVEYWILDLVNRRLEVFTVPRTGTRLGYAQHKTYDETDQVPVTLDGTLVGHVLVRDILPP